jgi:hypothetical protein
MLKSWLNIHPMESGGEQALMADKTSQQNTRRLSKSQRKQVRRVKQEACKGLPAPR